MQASTHAQAGWFVVWHRWILVLCLGILGVWFVVTKPAAPPTSIKSSIKTFVGPEAVEESAILSLAFEHWQNREADPQITSRLADACETFVRKHSAHSHAFNYQLRAQDLRGTRDLDALAATLDAAADKLTPQFAHNTISFGNVCFLHGDFDAALARYETAIVMPECPPDRRGEAGMMMGTILRQTKQYERARQAFATARQHTRRFPAIEGEIALIDLETGRQPAESALGPRVHISDPAVSDADREQDDPVCAPVFRDHEIHDRGMVVHLLALGCHEKHTTEIAVSAMGTGAQQGWPSAGSKTVCGPAWLSEPVVIIPGMAMPPFALLNERESLHATRHGWNGSVMICGPLKESGAIENGCDGD